MQVLRCASPADRWQEDPTMPNHPPSPLVKAIMFMILVLAIVLAFLIGLLPAMPVLSAPRPQPVIERAAGQRDMTGCAVNLVFRYRILAYPKQLGSFCGGYLHRSEPSLKFPWGHHSVGHGTLKFATFSRVYTSKRTKLSIGVRQWLR